jgi:NCAIR mutase (PurE)-related protein
LDRDALRAILEQLSAGKLSVDGALDKARLASVEKLAFATLDLERSIRRGIPEVVYGAGKTPRQVVTIVGRMRAAKHAVIVTRVSDEVKNAIVRKYPEARWHAEARILSLDRAARRRERRTGIVVVCAGTSDLPVAEEAAVTAELMGNAVERIVDVGVAGLHRLLEHRRTLTGARVIVVVAGMEGALPSVVAGLTDCPVIGVPTSVGYGTGANGIAALLAMLNSCASGLTVVNIDNGFGAGCAAALINRQVVPRAKPS